MKFKNLSQFTLASLLIIPLITFAQSKPILCPPIDLIKNNAYQFTDVAGGYNGQPYSVRTESIIKFASHHWAGGLEVIAKDEEEAVTKAKMIVNNIYLKESKYAEHYPENQFILICYYQSKDGRVGIFTFEDDH